MILNMTGVRPVNGSFTGAVRADAISGSVAARSRTV